MQTLKLKWKDIIGNTTGRVMLSLMAFAIILCSGFIIYTYNSKIDSYREAEISKLESIANSLAVQIDGEAHSELLARYPKVNDIFKIGQDPYYDEVHNLLKQIKNANGLNTEIYTLVYDEANHMFEFGVSSGENPFYRHTWHDFDEMHISKFNTGGNLGPYKDENGVWLSSFTPIKNQAGEPVALIQVDEPFDSFITKANNEVSKTILLMVGVLSLLVYAMLHVVQRLLNKADKVKKTLHKQRVEIEVKNREMLSSITRAKTIQDSILPQMDQLKKVFPEMFIMFEPKDIVSGDFFWYGEKGNGVYFAVADCTGHGVPGAFMSMMGHTILNDVLKYNSIDTPAEILTALDHELTRMLRENGGTSADGMDIALIRYCKLEKKIEFAGAMRPLYVTSDKKIVKYKGDKFSIGGHAMDNKSFTNQVVDIQPGDTMYMFSDGYYDQFGGEKNKKYMSKKFGDFLLFADDHHIEDRQFLLQYEFHHWKAEEEQIDDVLVAGIKFPEAA